MHLHHFRTLTMARINSNGTNPSPATIGFEAKLVRQINACTRDDGPPLNDTLVNLKDWCKNSLEVIAPMANAEVRMRN